MAQDITPSSTLAAITTFINTFITVQTDGSKRVDEAAMVKWLTEQFGYVIGPTAYSSRMSAGNQAFGIVANLAAIVNRENWETHTAYPKPGTNTTASARERLIALRTQMAAEVTAIEAPYKTFRAGLAGRLRSIYNATVLPAFPVGEDRTETTAVYIETYVTDWGEESQPSAASALTTCDENDTRTVTCSAAPSGRNITKRRLYRSATGTQASAFKLQGEYPIATTVIVDDKEDKLLTDVCATTGWLEPPATLKGLVGGPNGMMLGFVDRTLYACEPYHPYAFPAKYDKPLAHPIVGIVAVGQSFFVGTVSRPYLVSGTDAASLSEELISSEVPCSSARSMVAIGNAVVYASPYGLALYENGKVVIVSDGVIDRKEWETYNPQTMRAAEWDGMYVAFFTKADSTKAGLIFDFKARAFSYLDQGADAVFADKAGLYALLGTTIYDLFPVAGAGRTGKWYSKTFRLARPQSFGWLMLDFSGRASGTPTATVRIYADGVLLDTATMSGTDPVRLPPGRFHDWRVEVESTSPIDGVVLASSVEELKEAV